MRVLYFDCSMGAAGDMISAGLYELLGDSDKKTFTDKLSTIIKGLGDVSFSYDRSMKGGVTGTHFKVVVNGTEEKSVDVHSAAEPPHGAPVPPQGLQERPVVMPAHHSEERERYLRNHPEANSHTYRYRHTEHRFHHTEHRFRHTEHRYRHMEHRYRHTEHRDMRLKHMSTAIHSGISRLWQQAFLHRRMPERISLQYIS